MDLALLRQTAGLRPDAAVEKLGVGSDCAAWLIGGQVVVKVPSHAHAASVLSREAAILSVVRGHVRIAVPDMVFLAGPPPMSRHNLIAGEHLLGAMYDTLDPALRDRLASDLAQFHHDCHRIPALALVAAGAEPVRDWPLPRSDMLQHVPPDLVQPANLLLAEWSALPPDPCGTVWGHFDAHGWNMAFDHGRKVLNGIYDFGDSGFGPLHRDLIYSALISPDLTQRLGRAYARVSGQPLDIQRLRVLSGAHRLWELADATEGDRTFQIAALRRWAGYDWNGGPGKT